MQEKCPRNRKRSQRRAIFCPVDSCQLHSVSQKYRLFADQAQQLQARGLSQRTAAIVMAEYTTVSIDGEWIEAFWCDECKASTWYYVKRTASDASHKAASYALSIVPTDLWQQMTGVLGTRGNPSVSEFTLRQSRAIQSGVRDFKFVR